MTATVFLENNPDLSEQVTIARATSTAPRRLTCSANDKLTHRRSAAPAADRVRQRRRARPGARLAAGLRRLHRADEREGARARAPEHALRRSVRPAVRQRVVGVRHGAPDHPASDDERIASIMRTSSYTVYSERRDDHVPQHEPPAAAATTSTCARARPVSSRSPATAWRRCSGCRRAASRSRSSCSARGRTPAGSWRRRISSTGCAAKAVDDLRDRDATPVAAHQELSRIQPRTLSRRSPSCIAAASSGSVAIASTATMTGRLAWRPSYAFSSGGMRRTRTRDTVRRGSRTR